MDDVHAPDPTAADGAETPEPAPAPSSGDAPVDQDAVIETLRSVSLFEGLDDEDLARIRDISEPLSLTAGETLFEEGDKGETFYVIVSGNVELIKASAKGTQKLAVLRAGQAFGEMALLNRAPRSATARAAGHVMMLTISHDSFEALLGGESLALRVMRGLSRALWATSVRLTAKQTVGGEAKTAVNELNRVVRGQLTARETPQVDGYEIAAKAAFHAKSRGQTTWDTFRLPDGRPVISLMSAEGSGLLHAQNLAVTRAAVRTAAGGGAAGLGAVLTEANRALVAVEVAGVSQPVAVMLLAVGPDAVEWGSAGPPLGVHHAGSTGAAPLDDDSPPLGAHPQASYASHSVTLGEGHALIAFAEGASHAPRKAAEVLAVRGDGSATELLDAVVEEVARSDAGLEGIFDTVAAMVRRVGSAAAQEAPGEDPEHG